ncbi:pyruvate kinase [Vibrio stylophorae]|nr:pyruvate kinase [Vibrio stylophorae]
MRKTKIVATLGPASHSAEQIEKLIIAGANVFRLNFSHGSAEQHLATAQSIRQVAAKLNQAVGILADLQGPKIRIARFAQDAVELKHGQAFTLNAALAEDVGDESQVGLDYPELVADVKAGDRLLLDDGRIQLDVTAVHAPCIETTVVVAGKLSNRKGINLLGGGLSAPALTDKDKADILTAAQIEADFIAVSFPRHGQDIEYARGLVRQAGSMAQIVAKVERAEVVASVEAMDEMIGASDVIMVARGDLGVEIGDARLPLVQKRLIQRCRLLGKPVITATQMMESMITSPMPTRAEVLDVANAVFDGTDAVMLSAETAAGQYPVEAVASMARIAEGAEQDQVKFALPTACHCDAYQGTMVAMAAAAAQNANMGVVALTKQGQSVLALSRLLENNDLWALTDNPSLVGKMALLRGVYPVYVANLFEQARSGMNLHHLPLPAASLSMESLLVTRCTSLEGMAAEDFCQLIHPQQQLAPVA